MRFRRWVVFAFAVHLLVVLIDKAGGFILYLVTQDAPKDKGAADLLSHLPYILMAVANLGLATSLVYYVRKKRFAIQEVAETSTVVAVVWGGLFAAVAFGVCLVVVPLLLPDWELNLYLVGMVCLSVPFLLLISYYNSIQLASDRVGQYYLVHLIKSASFVPLFLLFYWLSGKVVTDSIALARLVTAVFLAGVVLWMVRNLVRIRPRIHWPFLREGVTYGWRANVSSVLTYINLRFNMYVIPLMWTAPAALAGGAARDQALQQVAFYSFALTWSELVWHFPDAMRDLFFSKIASSSSEEASRLTPVLNRLCLAAAVVGGVVIYFLVDPVMALISAEDNWGTIWADTVHGCLIYLLPGTAAFTTAKVLQTDLAARDQLNLCIRACGITTVVMVTVDLLVIPDRGAVGAAIAMLCAYTVSSVYTLFAYRRATGVGILECLLIRRSDWTYGKEIFGAMWAKVRSWNPGR